MSPQMRTPRKHEPMCPHPPGAQRMASVRDPAAPDDAKGVRAVRSAQLPAPGSLPKPVAWRIPFPVPVDRPGDHLMSAQVGIEPPPSPIEHGAPAEIGDIGSDDWIRPSVGWILFVGKESLGLFRM